LNGKWLLICNPPLGTHEWSCGNSHHERHLNERMFYHSSWWLNVYWWLHRIFPFQCLRYFINAPIFLVPFSVTWFKDHSVFLLIFIFWCMWIFVHIKVVNKMKQHDHGLGSFVWKLDFCLPPFTLGKNERRLLEMIIWGNTYKKTFYHSTWEVQASLWLSKRVCVLKLLSNLNHKWVMMPVCYLNYYNVSYLWFHYQEKIHFMKIVVVNNLMVVST